MYQNHICIIKKSELNIVIILNLMLAEIQPVELIEHQPVNGWFPRMGIG